VPHSPSNQAEAAQSRATTYIGKKRGPRMSKIENIENEIRNLTDAELAALRKWFIEFDAEA
jgi:hypothetical protein